MIIAKTWYKIWDSKFLAIMEFFKTCWNYVKDYKNDIFIFTNHNNLYQFIDTKNLHLK